MTINYPSLLLPIVLSWSVSLISMECCEKQSFLKPIFGLSARQGYRPHMEDNHTQLWPFGRKKEWGFFALYDGHGGNEASQIAADSLHCNFLHALQEKKPAGAHDKLLKNVFLAIDESIQKETIAGTTAIVAFLEKHKLCLAWAGDSRGLVIRGKNIIQATQDHKPNVAKEKERIQSKEVDGIVYFESRDNTWRVRGLSTSRTLGTKWAKMYPVGAVIAVPEIVEVSVENNDIIVLGCDGLWDVMSNEDVSGLIYSLLQKDISLLQKIYPGMPLPIIPHIPIPQEEKILEDGSDEHMKLIARALRDEALDRGSTDNISVMVVQLKENALIH